MHISWLYRIRPGVIMSAQTPYKQAGGGLVSDPSHLKLDPTQMRWGPIPHAAATEEVDFVDSLRTQGTATNQGNTKLHACDFVT